MWHYLFLLLGILSTGCELYQKKGLSTHNFLTDTLRVDAQNVPLHKHTNYLPPEMASKGLDFVSYNFHEFQEPLLYNKKLPTTYRFLCVLSFFPHFCIRITKNEKGDYTAEVKQEDSLNLQFGKNVYGAIHRIKKISKEKVGKLEQKLKELDFWNQPHRILPEYFGPDGSSWVFEVHQKGRYHALLRDGGSRKEMELAKLFLELADFRSTGFVWHYLLPPE